MTGQLNDGVGDTAVAKPDGPIGRAPSKLAQDHSGAPTAVQEIKDAVETKPSGRVDDGARQEPSVDLPALSLEELRNLTAIEKGFEESETPTEIHPPSESIAVDLPGLSLQELMTFEAIEGTSSYKWKPITDVSVDLPALSLEGLKNLMVIEKDFEESETPERIAVNRPTSPEHGGGANFTPFNLSSIIVQLPAPLVSFATDADFAETQGDSIFAVLSDREGTTRAVNTPTSTISDSDAAANQVSESAANGTAVGVTALATDADASDTVTYSLTNDAGGRFAIDANSGVITVADTTLLDYETQTSHTVEVTATSTDGSTSVQSFTINLTDDTAEFSIGPIINSGRIDINNYDQTDQGFSVTARRIDDNGDLTNGSSAIIFTGPDGMGVIGSTGTSAPANQLGYDPTFEVSEELIFDFDNPVSTATVSVTLLFASEGPSGEQGHWEAFKDGISVGQGDFQATSGSSVTFVIDLGPGVTFDSLIFTANPYIGGQDGVLTNSSDYFIQSIEYTYEDPPTVSESVANGATVGITALATDADATDSVTYSLTNDAGGRFAIDANSGVITVADTTLLDYETQTSHTVEVTATSTDGSTSVQSFTINLTDVIEGTSGNDTLNGTAGDDVILGFAGSDTLNGLAGNDSLDGGADSDDLFGGDGNDTLDGGADGDTLDGGAGNDTLRGGTGDDILVWDSLDLTIDGGAGSDTLRVDAGDADLTAFAGTIAGIEVIDLQADTGANTVTLTAQQVLDLSDTDTVTVLGDSTDTVNAGTGWTDGGFDGNGNHVFTQSVGETLATLLLDPDITPNPDITA